MALQSSGAISLQDIEDEFGGAGSISLSEYYRNGGKVTSNNTSVPTSGTIDFADFYGTVKRFEYTFSSSAKEVNLNTTLTNAGWDGSAPVLITINSGIYLWSDNTSVAGLTISSAFNNKLTIINNGYIIGRGGNGGTPPGTVGTSAQAGGPAISNSASGVTLTNASGAFIAGGGGGGGVSDSRANGAGGGGGGAGGGHGGNAGLGASGSGGAGGAIGQAGSNGTGTSPGQGGGAGGGGNHSADYNNLFGGGGGGGRILPGTGGSGGGTGGCDGGSAGNAGGTSTQNVDHRGGGGGGGWGAAGGAGTLGSSGGAGGAAISGTAISVTNNGTIYGTQA